MGRTISYRPKKMSAIIGNINLNQTDMDNTDYKAFTDAYDDRMKRLNEMVANRNKAKQSTYGRRTTCATTPQRTCAVTSQYDPYAPPSVSRQQQFPETPAPTHQEIEIDKLTTENLKLKRDYAELLKKTTTLVEAYKGLSAAYDALTAKKAKVDAKKKTVEDVQNVFKNIGDRFMTWLKT